MIRNEIKLFLSRKNILLFLAALAAVFSLYMFRYEKVYREYPGEQMEKTAIRLDNLTYFNTLYGNRVAYLEAYEPENERLEAISRSAEIFSSLEALCRMEWECWENWEEQEEMLRKLQRQQDDKLVNAPDKIDPGEGTLFNSTRQEWNQRMLLHDAYEKAGVLEPVNKAEPTGAYAVYQGLDGTGIVFLVLALLVVGWNFDIWSADFDEETGKLLYTLPFSRKRIFFSRCLIHWGFTMAGLFLVLGALFLIGTFRFGTGLEDFQTVSMQALRGFALFSTDAAGSETADLAISMGAAVGLRLLGTLMFFTLFFAVIQFFSFAWKNSTSVVVTVVVLITLVGTLVIMPTAFEWEAFGEKMGVVQTGIWQKLNPLFYFQNERILSGEMGIGMPLALLLEAVCIGAVIAGTCIWMKRREL
ncbi:MAG: ABC transporter permease [Clostridiales bacterium]|nr:ABC transporter permease [Clostridiales bacterium]